MNVLKKITNFSKNRNFSLKSQRFSLYFQKTEIISLRTHQKCIKMKKTVFYAQKYNIILQICDIRKDGMFYGNDKYKKFYF